MSDVKYSSQLCFNISAVNFHLKISPELHKMALKKNAILIFPAFLLCCAMEDSGWLEMRLSAKIFESEKRIETVISFLLVFSEYSNAVGSSVFMVVENGKSFLQETVCFFHLA